MRIITLHETRYEYQNPVHAAFNEVRLHPRDDAHQTCTEFSLCVDPDAPMTTGEDYFGNVLHSFNILEPHRAMVVTARSTVEVHREPFKMQAPLSDWDVKRARVDYMKFDGPIEDIPAIHDLARDAGLDARGLSQEQVMGTMRQAQTIFTDWFGGTQNLNGLIRERFQYAPMETDVDTAISHVFETGRGVCQDFAHIFIAVCRAAGLPSRYVSGYLITDKSRSAGGGVATHAWAETLLPGGNWVGFDPTNNLLANNYYIKIAVGRDYRDVAPTRGLYRGFAGQTKLLVRITNQVEDEDSTQPQPQLVG